MEINFIFFLFIPIIILTILMVFFTKINPIVIFFIMLPFVVVLALSQDFSLDGFLSTYDVEEQISGGSTNVDVSSSLAETIAGSLVFEGIFGLILNITTENITSQDKNELPIFDKKNILDTNIFNDNFDLEDI